MKAPSNKHASSTDSLLAPRAAWEAARAAEDAGRRETALAWYGRASLGGEDAAAARFRAGLLHFAAGRAGSTTVVAMTFDELLAGAEEVFVGEVVSQRSA